MTEIRELYPIKNSLYLSDFNQVIYESTKFDISIISKKTPKYQQNFQKEKQFLYYRGQLGLENYDLILDEIKDQKSTPIGLRCLRIYAKYLKFQKKANLMKIKKEKIIKKTNNNTKDDDENDEGKNEDEDEDEDDEDIFTNLGEIDKKIKKFEKIMSDCSLKIQDLRTSNQTDNNKNDENDENDEQNDSIENLMIISCLLYSNEKQFGSILRLIDQYEKSSKSSLNLEFYHFKIISLLNMNRVDLAQSCLKVMSEQNDDATITQISSIYVLIFKGDDESLTEANHLTKQLIEKFGETCFLLNIKSVIEMKRGKFLEAEKLLHSSLKQNHQNYDTLINLVVVGTHLMNQSKSKGLIEQYINQIKKNHKIQHNWILKYKKIENQFDNLAKKFLNNEN